MDGVQRKTRPRVLIPLACLVVCSGLVTVVVRRAIEGLRCTMCECQLKSIGTGLRCFDSSDGGLPPAYLCNKERRPIHSWCSLLLPYLGCYTWHRYYSLREPWDGPNNGTIPLRPYHYFQCSSAGDRMRETTDYVAVVGPDTMWPGRERVKLRLEPGCNPETILLIEMPDSDYRCLEPRFPTVDEFIARIKSPTGKGIRCIHRKGLAYLTIAGNVRWFSPDTDPETIRRLLRRDPKCDVISPEAKMRTVENWEKGEE
jgi:hypothetical protein